MNSFYNRLELIDELSHGQHPNATGRFTIYPTKSGSMYKDLVKNAKEADLRSEVGDA